MGWVYEWEYAFWGVGKCHFHILCSELRAFIEKQTTKLWKPISVDKKNYYYAISFRWTENVKNCKQIQYWQSNRLTKGASSLQVISRFAARTNLKSPWTEEVKLIMAKIYEQHELPHCVGGIKETHVGIKSFSHFINTKENYTINCQAAADYTTIVSLMLW